MASVKRLVVAMLLVVLFGAMAGLAGAQRGQLAKYVRTMTASALDAVADRAVRSAQFQARLRALKTQGDELANSVEKTPESVSEPMPACEDEITDAPAQPDTAERDAAEDRDRISGELDRMRTELQQASADIASMRAEMTTVSNDLRALQQPKPPVEKLVLDQHIAKAASQSNEKIIALAVHGFERLKLGDVVAALTDFQACHACDPACAEYLYGLALCQWQRGDAVAAEWSVAHAVAAEQRRPMADWYRRCLVGIQGPHRQFLEKAKADPTLLTRVAHTPR